MVIPVYGAESDAPDLRRIRRSWCDFDPKQTAEKGRLLRIENQPPPRTSRNGRICRMSFPSGGIADTRGMREFRSAVDWWIGAILIGIAVLIPVFLGLALVGSPADPTTRVSLLAGAALLASIMTGLVWPVRYQFRRTELVVISGLLRQRIPYDQITSVEPTRAPWSSPALSLDRLRIRYRRTWLLVSPADQHQFLRELTRRAPQLLRQ